ncbi:MAG: succinate--CoA ligase subunit alpha, partial [Desulfovibrio sp.]|nr:succinate--CoA ligase subunit alpha [Desulfovibrio sp.]
MSILVDETSRVLVQGLTGHEGLFHCRQMLDYGTNVVAGVTPGKGGQEAMGVPVFNSVNEAVKQTGANVSIIFVPASASVDSACEAAESGIPLIVIITEHIPVLDMVRCKAFLKDHGASLIG